jgi:benzodiazapine receptor
MWRVAVPLLLNFFVQGLMGEVNYRAVPTGAIPTPPSYVFGIVWTVLYLLLGGVLYRTRAPILLALWAFNMLVNLSWTYIVFVRKNVVGGVYLIVSMIGTTLAFAFLTDDKWSRGMLVPYLTWLMVALILNVEMARGDAKNLKKI